MDFKKWIVPVIHFPMNVLCTTTGVVEVAAAAVGIQIVVVI